MVKAVLFDFNGTLFQDSKFNEDAWLEFADKIAGRKISRQEFDENIHGKNNRLALEYLFGRRFTKEEAIEWGEKKEDIYRQMVRDNPKDAHLTEGVTEFLDFLVEKQVPHNIATAAGLGNVEFYYEIFGLDKWFPFDQIVYDNGEINSKPAPDFYLKAAEKINVSASDCLIFEDSISGIRAAHNAGAEQIFGITTNGNDAELLELGLVTGVIDNYRDQRIYDVFN